MISKKPKSKTKKELPEPLTASLDDYNRLIGSCDSEPTRGTRANAAGSITRLSRFANVDAGVSPFVYGAGAGKYNSNISLQDTIMLCQKAYWNVPIFRNTIDLMTEFAMSHIYFSGGNKESRNFMNIWASKIGLWSLCDMFFREYFRSGNVFLYKLFGEFPKESMRKLQEMNLAEAALRVPLRYIILNPYDIQVLASSSFITPSYKKRLNSFELGALINPTNEADKQIANAIPEIRRLGKSKNATVELDLASDKLICVFYKKQDYEPLAVPMGFPVLEDINWKLELKKIDMAISRTIQQAVLLITQGSEELGPPSEKNQAALRKIFENGSVGRVLIADFTTKAEFVIPQIGDILDPRKYEIVDKDIRLGLNNILFGDDKFASTSAKMDAFFKRLEFAREEFMVKFLIPQVNEVAKMMNFKAVPVPKWKSKNFKDNSAILSRVYTRLLELGAISPQDAVHAIEDNRLPDDFEMQDSQKQLLEEKDKGYYEPLLNNGKEDATANGRPPGSSAKQTTKKVSPIGTKSVATYRFGITAIAKTLKDKEELEELVGAELRKRYGIKKMSVAQKEVASDLTNLIVGAEEKQNWRNKIGEYMDNPSLNTMDSEVTKTVFEIAATHGIEEHEAAILYHSKE